jgi:hypothetical protein
MKGIPTKLAVVMQFACHPELAFLRSEGPGRAARCVAQLLLRKAATQKSRVWLASLPNCTMSR